MLRLGTRGSRLALWQADAVSRYMAAAGGPACQIVVIKTAGDRLHDAPLAPAGGKRLFVKEIEEALLDGRIDLAVHSAKDLPAQLPKGLTIGAVLAREDPRDAIVLRAGFSPSPATLRFETDDALESLFGRSPDIGTGSIRRIAQLTALVPGGRFSGVRGNIDTRLRKLDAGDHDALVLAAAGLKRLGFGARISMELPVIRCVPAPGQGVIAIEVSEEQDRTLQIVRSINHPTTFAALEAERALVAGLDGGCQMPLGALAASSEARELELVAVVAAPDGAKLVRAQARGSEDAAEALGTRVADRLRAQGAEELLAAARRAVDAAGDV